ncbi:hypothetical protein CLIB1444_03S02014 [[Candida] jaroonii]|uniref:Uncharacterized protein n=1 Tax=[Candida] jaroonii TaxID=467808 RepID=A0ACA9Y526_9ASCO|nr:hypothetical protein CLIB1444_03S02014 [[Candida] jaroonii]
MELFHLSPYYGATMTLFVIDIVRAARLKEIYGSKCQTMSREGWFMINNHPLKKVKVRGTVKSLMVKEFDDISKNFVVLNIDDSSGIASNIGVKVDAKLWFPQLLECEGRTVEVTGEVYWYYRKEIVCDTLMLLQTDLEGEIRHWKECFETRDKLRIPWTYKPPTNKVNLIPPFMNDERLGGGDMEVEILEAGEKDKRDVDMDEVVEIDSESDSDNDREIVINEVIELDSESDSDIEALSPSTHPTTHSRTHSTSPEIKLITESQLLTEILIFLLKRNCQPTSLTEIYNDPMINNKLNDHLMIQMTVKRGSGTPSEILNQKYQLFHYLRHELVMMRLIVTTKSQIVFSKELSKLKDSVKSYLHQVKVENLCFNVENFSRIYCNQNHINVTSKILNGIIEWIILQERHLWRYDRKRIEWIFNA